MDLSNIKTFRSLDIEIRLGGRDGEAGKIKARLVGATTRESVTFGFFWESEHMVI